MRLNVFFTNTNELGLAYLTQNLITNKIKLTIYKNVNLGEIEAFVDKAVKQLEQIYGKIEVKIYWDTLKESEK